MDIGPSTRFGARLVVLAVSELAPVGVRLARLEPDYGAVGSE